MLNKFFKTDKGIYVESEIALDNFIEVSKEEYDLNVNPTEEQKIKAYIFSNDTPSNKKEYLYTSLRYYLNDDYFFDTTRPFFDEGLSVDEIQSEIFKYDGDREDYVALLKTAKKEAKQYIRNLIANLGGNIHG